MQVGLLVAAPEQLVRNSGRPIGRLLYRLRLLHLHGWRVRFLVPDPPDRRRI